MMVQTDGQGTVLMNSNAGSENVALLALVTRLHQTTLGM